MLSIETLLPQKEQSLIIVTLLPIMTFLRDLCFAKCEKKSQSHLKFVNLSHSLNAYSPMVVKLLGRERLCRELQLPNAE